jgi:protein involved in polysaccharide export with SLBB domain
MLPHRELVSKFLIASIALFLLFGAAQRSWAQGSPEYKLSPNDLVDFRVFQEPELDSVVRISGEGQANFPLIGVVALGGKTTGEAIEVLKSRYRNGYLINPQISLTVRSYAKKLFTVLGQVQKPGSYDIIGTSQITLLQAIGMAGGYTKIADSSNVTIKRVEDGREQVLKFNAKRMLRGDDPTALLVKPGDVISVGESLF